MFGSVERRHLYPCREHHVHVAAALPVEAGLVGKQPDAFALQRSKRFLLQHIEAGERRMILRDRDPIHVAAMVAIVLRHSLMLRPPLGWTRLVMITTNDLLAGSIHNAGPVNPVCP